MRCSSSLSGTVDPFTQGLSCRHKTIFALHSTLQQRDAQVLATAGHPSRPALSLLARAPLGVALSLDPQAVPTQQHRGTDAALPEAPPSRTAAALGLAPLAPPAVPTPGDGARTTP